MALMELLGLLLSLAGFGVDANPQAPSATEVLATAPPRADYMAHVDLVAIVPNNVGVLLDLPKHPALANQPEIKSQLELALSRATAARAMATGLLGMDPVTDVTSATAWLSVPDRGDPLVLIAVRGKFPVDFVARVGNPMGVPVKKVKGVDAITSPDGDAMLALTSSGTLLLGTPSLVKPRLATSYKRRKASPLIRGVQPMLNGKPAMLFASAPSKRLVRTLTRELTTPDERIALDLATGHAFLGMAVHHNGVAWTARARTKPGYRRAVRASQGTLDLMRAFHHGARGFARIALAALPSFGGANPIADAIIEHSDMIEDLVMKTTGDGRFKVAFDSDPKTKTVRVTATGTELSDVFPAAGALPLLGGAGAWLLLARSGPMTPPTAAETRPLRDLSRGTKRTRARDQPVERSTKPTKQRSKQRKR